MKRRWLLVALVIGALALGITGGTILAQGDSANGDSPFKSFASRVATILGLDEAQVQDAFNQAAREMQDEALQMKLDRMVEQGRLTQEEAEQYRQWYQSRPETLSPGMPFGRFGRHGFHRGGMWGMRGWNGTGLQPWAPTPTPGASGTTSS